MDRAGFRVYGTGRSIERSALPERVKRLVYDQSDEARVKKVFGLITEAHGRLDVLVNCAWGDPWGGFEHMVEDGAFMWVDTFWKEPMWRWYAMMDAGLRTAYFASRLAARKM